MAVTQQKGEKAEAARSEEDANILQQFFKFLHAIHLW